MRLEMILKAKVIFWPQTDVGAARPREPRKTPTATLFQFLTGVLRELEGKAGEGKKSETPATEQ